MRPRGSYGEVARALIGAADGQGPGRVRDLADRAQVGRSVAAYTCSRLVDLGALVVLDPTRPAVLAVPPAGAALGEKLDELHRSFWDL